MNPARQTELRASGDRALRLIQRPQIGARWQPGHVVRFDSSSGFYEEVNAERMGSDALALQSALLAERRPQWRLLDLLFVVAMFGGAGVAAFLYLAGG